MNKISFSISSSRVAPVTLGAESVDRRLGKGLARGALHEIYADADNGTAGLGFGFLLALRSVAGKPIVIVREDRCVSASGRLYGDGVVDLGGDPASLIVVHTVDSLATLRAAAEAVVCSDVGAVIVEPWRRAPVFDLTASRRIAWRAERSGVMTFIARIGIDPMPSAAATRWRVHGAPSNPFAAGAPGKSTFEISLLRHRGGIAGFDARVEWDRDQRSFRDATLSCLVPAVAAGGARDPDVRRAA